MFISSEMNILKLVSSMYVTVYYNKITNTAFTI